MGNKNAIKLSDNDDQIDMSKQLAKKKIRNGKHASQTMNCIPMPGLSELEAMFRNTENNVSSTSTSNSMQGFNKSTIPLPNISNNHPLRELRQQQKSKKRDSAAMSQGSKDYFQPVKKFRGIRSKDRDIVDIMVNTQNEEKNGETREIDNLHNISTDSNETITYDYSSHMRAFSPLPSTSRDNATILRNEHNFNLSLSSQSAEENDEISNLPSVLFIEDNEEIKSDSTTNLTINNNSMANDSDCIIINNTDVTPVENKSIRKINHNNIQHSEGDCIIINDVEEHSGGNTIIPNEHSQMNTDSAETILTTTNVVQNSDELIDVDEYIKKSENQKICIKYSKKKMLNKEPATVVDLTGETDPALKNVSLLNRLNMLKEIVTDYFKGTVGETKCHSITAESVNPLIVNGNKNIMDNVKQISNGSIHAFTTNQGNNNNHNCRCKCPTLPSKLVQGSSEVKSLIECPICLETLINKAVASTFCGHLFCLPCIKKAFKKTKNKCPACRKVLFGKGYHLLYL